jgi:hypothetical protein
MFLERVQRFHKFDVVSHYGSTDLATGWTTVKSWFYSQHGKEIFVFSKASRPALWRTQPTLQRIKAVLSLE